jgi:uncharacterized BrkB/YihY/UPF0761 family membrane protein
LHWRIGGVYVGHVVKGASTIYGTFATVIGLLTWLFLGSRVVVYSAEINSVLARWLWPARAVRPARARRLRSPARPD